MDYEQEIRRLKARVMGGITRGTLTSSGGGKVLSGGVKWLGKRISSAIEVLQPHGLFFKVPAGAEGVALGDRSSMSFVGAARRSDSPGAGELEDGEGGLYYAGTYKVFLNKDGEVCLGDKEPEDFVALSSKVDDFITRLDGVIRSGWTPVSMDGGAALQVAYLAEFTDPPESTASEVVKCK